MLSVCPFKTPPCARSKRPRVYRHHAHMLKHLCACCQHRWGRFECSHADVLDGHTGVTHRETRTRTDTHWHTENTHTQDTHGHTHRKHATRRTQNRIKTTIFGQDRCFLTHRIMSFAQSHFFQMSVASRPAQARAASAPLSHNVAWKTPHSRIFILRVEPSSERKDIVHIPQYQLNLRVLSFTAAVSTQNLDLPGFSPRIPDFPGVPG